MENRGRILIDVNLGGDESTRCCDQCQVGKVTERCSWWRCRWSSTTSQLSGVLLRLAGASQQGQPHSEAPQAPQMPHRALNHCHHIKKPQSSKNREKWKSIRLRISTDDQRQTMTFALLLILLFPERCQPHFWKMSNS